MEEKLHDFQVQMLYNPHRYLLLQTKRPWSFLVDFFGKRPQTCISQAISFEKDHRHIAQAISSEITRIKGGEFLSCLPRT
jgi:hypothetical protein